MTKSATAKFARLSALLIAAAVMGSAPARAEEIKIGTVDMQKALQTVDAGKKAKANLEKEVSSKKKEIQDEQASIQKAGEEFKKQSLVMNEEARARKQGELQERFAKLQEKVARTQQDLSMKEQEITRPIITKMRAIIQEMAKKKGYTVILEKNESTILFSQDKDDLTNDVISAYNSQAKS